MSRLQDPRTTNRRDSGPSRVIDSSIAASKKPKIVLEQVTQEKKKLRSVLTFKAEAPRGYTFVQAGNPQVTNVLKEAARQANVQIFAVSTTPHANVHDLSQQVHRVGFHFPNRIVDQICMDYGIRIASNGMVSLPSHSRVPLTTNHRNRKRDNRSPEQDQVTINTEARETIKDLFPNIPDNDLFTIIKTAFRKGKNKVGTANELSLIRRAQLAVVAHIRHVYTPYDKLLRSGGYHEARSRVEKATLERLVAWRGDDENGTQKLEDVLREVVVISDDEESDEDDIDRLGLTSRDVSVEILSSDDEAQRRIQVRPVEADQIHLLDDIEPSRPTGNRIINLGPRMRELPPSERQDRYRGIWSNAVQSFKADPTQHSRSFGQVTQTANYERSPPRFLGDKTRKEIPRQENASKSVRSEDPRPFRTADGTLYEPLPMEYPRRYGEIARRPSPPPARYLKRADRSPIRPLATDTSQRYPTSQGPRLFPLDPSEVAIPSIETESPASYSVRRQGGEIQERISERTEASVRTEPRRYATGYEHPVNDISNGVQVIRLASDRPANSAKRNLAEAFPNQGSSSERHSKMSRYATFADKHSDLPRRNDSSVIDLTSSPRRPELEVRLASGLRNSQLSAYEAPSRTMQAMSMQQSSPTSPHFPRGSHTRNPIFVDGPSDPVPYRRQEMPNVNEPTLLRRYAEYQSPPRTEAIRVARHSQVDSAGISSRQYPGEYVIRESLPSRVVPISDDPQRQ
ncbi:MAG: hypothetical protein Q9227_007028 [Pyrenula ochraceoflavens]